MVLGGKICNTAPETWSLRISTDVSTCNGTRAGESTKVSAEGDVGGLVELEQRDRLCGGEPLGLARLAEEGLRVPEELTLAHDA